MYRRAFVLEHLAKITAVDPAAAGWTSEEMLGLARGPFAKPPSEGLAARDVDYVFFGEAPILQGVAITNPDPCGNDRGLTRSHPSGTRH
jgi:hypothetical protein